MRPSHVSAFIAAILCASAAANAQGPGIESGGSAPETTEQSEEQAPVIEYGCSAVVNQDEGDGDLVAMPFLEVIEATEAEGAFVLALDETLEVRALMCDRSTPVPTALDYKVPDAGYPLYLRSGEGEARTVIALERPDNVYALRVVEGELGDEDTALIDERLAGYPAPLGE